MADRSLYSHLSDPPPTGLQFLQQYADRLGQVFRAAIWPLGAVGGSGNAVTASCDPPLTAGLVEHMRFAVTWAATNSGAMTLSIGGGTPAPVLASDGSDMLPGAAEAGSRAFLEYVGGAFLSLGGGVPSVKADPLINVITASTTWIKPPGYADHAQITIQAWGGGASGGKSNGGGAPGFGGGGGGGYVSVLATYAYVPSSLSIVIGAGGAALTSAGNGNAGGATTVGSLLTAPGGQPNNAATGGSGGRPGGLAGTIYAGGSGGEASGAGGNGIHGAGGGGGGNIASGGTAFAGGSSVFGGWGGAGGVFNNVSGLAGGTPGGGGGGAYLGPSSGAGARGEVRIWING